MDLTLDQTPPAPADPGPMPSTRASVHAVVYASLWAVLLGAAAIIRWVTS